MFSISTVTSDEVSITNSKINNNTGGVSVATIQGSARFRSVIFDTNTAQIGIEVFGHVFMDQVEWSKNEAEYHLYVRSGGSLDFGNASSVSTNLGTVGVFHLESNASCELRSTQVIFNNVSTFHLISVLESSRFYMIDSNITSNTISNVSQSRCHCY